MQEVKQPIHHDPPPGKEFRPRDVRRRNFLQLLAALIMVIALNLIGQVYFVRWDLTSEKRYTLTQGTRQMLRNLDEPVYFRVYLEGNLPPGFRRLSNQTREMLQEFRAYSDYIQFDFINPAESGSSRQNQQIQQMLIEKGLEPTQVQIQADDATTRQVIFPGALVSYQGREVTASLLEDHLGLSSEAILNNSAQALEYNLIDAIRQLTVQQVPKIAFLQGHGELAPPFVADITRTLSGYYDVDRLDFPQQMQELIEYKSLIVAKPQEEFSERDKFMIDQFVMQGGSVLWLVDPVMASMDSLRPPTFETLGMARSLNLDDMFFRYGVRLNPNLLMDLQAAPIPVTTGMIGSQPQISLLAWHFFPLLNPRGEHPMVRNLNMIRSEFVSSIDTVEVPGIKKTLLLATSPYTRVASTPVSIGLGMLQEPVNEQLFRGPAQPVAVLLEGPFESIFQNRPNPGVTMPRQVPRRDSGVPARMIVVADGDIIKNQISPEGQPLALGFDRYTNQTFGNKDFILNAVNYLTDDTGLMEARAREVKLRMLDSTLVGRNRLGIQLLNTLVPVLLVILFGMVRIFWRRRRYTR